MFSWRKKQQQPKHMLSSMYIVKVSGLSLPLQTCRVCVGFCALWVVMLTPFTGPAKSRGYVPPKLLSLFQYFRNRRVWFTHRRRDVPKDSPMVGSFLITHMCHACECEIAAPSPDTSTRVDAALLFKVLGGLHK